jgi:hypothetical protein
LTIAWETAQFGFCIFVLLTKQFWGSLITTELVFMSVSGSSAVNNLNDATFQGDRICISEEQLALDITAGEISPNPTSHWDTEKVRTAQGAPLPRTHLETLR